MVGDEKTTKVHEDKNNVKKYKSEKYIKYKKAWYKYSSNKMSVVGLLIVIAVIILGVLQPILAPFPHHAGKYANYKDANLPPNSTYLLGTDIFGRDVLSRIMYAFRGALTMGIGVLAIVVPIGSVLGLIAGYWKGRPISNFIMRVTDVFLALPPLILALCVGAILRPTLFNSMIAICVSWWPWYTRLLYGMVTSLRNELYVKSAELLGASNFHILFKEILPNCLGPILTKMTLDMGWVILNGAALSFVGLGEQPPTPALGSMVADGAKFLPDQWWISVFPAIAIVIIVLGFNLVGDGVNDMFSAGE